MKTARYTAHIKGRLRATALAAAALPLAALAQVPGQTPDAAARDAAEQRRAQERDARTREQQESRPDIRLQAPAPQQAQRLPLGETPCFPIRGLELRGEEAGRFGWLLNALSGPGGDDSPMRKCLGTAGIDLALRRAQAALQARGYVTTRVLAQPQGLSSGTLALTVLPGRIHAIRFADASGRRASTWSAMPARPGDILNLHDIEQALENFKRVPTVQADIRIESAEQAGPGLSDLVISHSQAFPLRLSLSADDSGTRSSGKYQGAATLSWSNPLHLSDLLYLTLNHDMGGGDAGYRGTRGGVVHYSVPLGNWMLGGTLSRNHHAQTVAGAGQDYVYAGAGRNAEVKLSRLLHRGATGKTTASLKAFQRQSNSYIDDTEIQVQRRVVGGWEAGLGHRELIGAATLEANAAYKRGTGAFGSMPAPEEAFGEGTSRFALATADAQLQLPFKLADHKLRYTTQWRIQSHRTPLTPQDRFALGGRYTVRGFDGESALSAERGWLLRNELGIALGNSGQELYAGLDHGAVGGPVSALLAGKHLTGAVVGLRVGFAGLQYDLFVGAPVNKPDLFRTAAVTAGFNLNYSF